MERIPIQAKIFFLCFWLDPGRYIVMSKNHRQGVSLQRCAGFAESVSHFIATHTGSLYCSVFTQYIYFVLKKKKKKNTKPEEHKPKQQTRKDNT